MSLEIVGSGFVVRCGQDFDAIEGIIHIVCHTEASLHVSVEK